MPGKLVSYLHLTHRHTYLSVHPVLAYQAIVQSHHLLKFLSLALLVLAHQLQPHGQSFAF